MAAYRILDAFSLERYAVSVDMFVPYGKCSIGVFGQSAPLPTCSVCRMEGGQTKRQEERNR